MARPPQNLCGSLFRVQLRDPSGSVTEDVVLNVVRKRSWNTTTSSLCLREVRTPNATCNSYVSRAIEKRVRRFSPISPPRSIVEAPQVRISERAQERMLTLGSRIGLGRVSNNTQ